MLPSAIDDAEMGITHVVRGEDHVTNTAAQIQMFEALGSAPPAFAHAALLTGKDGKLSKRMGSLGVDALRENGIEPIALLALLARLGTSDAVTPETSLAPLIEGIDYARFGRAPARFDEDELTALNARTLHMLGYQDVADRLPEGMTAQAWEAIRPNINVLADAADWWQVVTGPVSSAALPEDREYLDRAAALLPELDWNADPWHALTAALKAETGRSGKQLFLPLRRALTGRDHGPDMKALLPLIGLEQAQARLS